MSGFEIFLGIWSIPLIKRQAALVSQLAFTVFSAYVFFLPLCGSVSAVHFVWSVWVFTNLLAEVVQYRKEPIMWWQNAFNLIDVLVVVLMMFAGALRFALTDEASISATSVSLRKRLLCPTSTRIRPHAAPCTNPTRA